MIEYGADLNFKVPTINWTMPVCAIMRERPNLLDIMLENGIDMDYKINGKQVSDDLLAKNKKLQEVQIKHKRWRNLRKFLKLEEQVGTGTTTK